MKDNKWLNKTSRRKKRHKKTLNALTIRNGLRNTTYIGMTNVPKKGSFSLADSKARKGCPLGVEKISEVVNRTSQTYNRGRCGPCSTLICAK
ncbi:hypothetical protein RvY_03470 [Ramazzottius varieornatus]|uniref:Uncharacterized protein n=1 Tax=Ramazzottius varieornatus TaxID=947166 RepID=A0A1D1UN56_RAMVA|nr:hypothetical protein RvY_03470 [Ramazzottius varieornatus]